MSTLVLQLFVLDLEILYRATWNLYCEGEILYTQRH